VLTALRVEPVVRVPVDVNITLFGIYL